MFIFLEFEHFIRHILLVHAIIAIYESMIYTAPYVMLLMRANPLRGQVGWGWALEISTFWGKRHQVVRRMPFDFEAVASAVNLNHKTY